MQMLRVAYNLPDKSMTPVIKQLLYFIYLCIYFKLVRLLNVLLITTVILAASEACIHNFT